MRISRRSTWSSNGTFATLNDASSIDSFFFLENNCVSLWSGAEDVDDDVRSSNVEGIETTGGRSLESCFNISAGIEVDSLSRKSSLLLVKESIDASLFGISVAVAIAGSRSCFSRWISLLFRIRISGTGRHRGNVETLRSMDKVGFGFSLIPPFPPTLAVAIGSNG